MATVTVPTARMVAMVTATTATATSTAVVGMVAAEMTAAMTAAAARPRRAQMDLCRLVHDGRDNALSVLDLLPDGWNPAAGTGRVGRARSRRR